MSFDEDSTMPMRRVVPNVYSRDVGASAAWYETIGMRRVMDAGWMVTLASATEPTAQLSVFDADPSGQQPTVSVEVEDVDVVHARAVNAGFDIVYPLRDEPWGVRRFFARAPEGTVVNVMSHL